MTLYAAARRSFTDYDLSCWEWLTVLGFGNHCPGLFVTLLPAMYVKFISRASTGRSVGVVSEAIKDLVTIGHRPC